MNIRVKILILNLSILLILAFMLSGCKNMASSQPVYILSIYATGQLVSLETGTPIGNRKIYSYMASPQGGVIGADSIPTGEVITGEDGKFTILVLQRQVVESDSPATASWIFGIVDTDESQLYLGENDKILNVDSGVVYYYSGDAYTWVVGHSMDSRNITVDAGQIKISE